MTTKLTVTHGFRGLLRPSKDQEVLINKTFGCCRKLWNMRLENVLKEEPLYLSIPQYREEFPFMKEIDSLALCNAEKNQIKAFKNYKITLKSLVCLNSNQSTTILNRTQPVTKKEL